MNEGLGKSFMESVRVETLKEKKLLLIVGEQKCGTTSLFDYLSAHPNIFGSNRKQTFFFMPDGFQKMNKTEVPIGYSVDPCEFLRLFPGYSGSEDFLLEATPDYLHTKQALERIKAFRNVFKEIVILIILRDPIERFRSWFNFAKQQQTIDQSTTIEKFYQMNRQVEESYVSFDSCFFALDTGRYEKSIPGYIEAFGNNVKVYSFEEMKSHPYEFMVQLSSDVGVDDDFYKGYEFKASNTTVSARFSLLRTTYMKLRSFYLALFGEQLRYYLRPASSLISRAYHGLNDKKVNGDTVQGVEDAIFKRLRIDYENTYVFCDDLLDIRWDKK